MPRKSSKKKTPAEAGAASALGQPVLESTPVSSGRGKKKQKLQERIVAMETLEKLVHRRGVAKGKVTRILNTIRPDPEEEPNLSEAQAKVYLSKLESAHKEFNDVHDKILAVVPADQYEIHDQNGEEFEILHEEVLILLEDQVTKLNATAANPAVVAPNQQAPVVMYQPLRMPVPTFDGRYESWPKFKAMFKDLVDKGPDPPAVKLYHLDKALVGSAAGILDVKTINEGNYEHAWRILEERFENKRHAIDTHIHGLFNLKRMSKESHTELRSLVDECTKHVEGLKFLEQEVTGVSELFLVHLLATALDKETRRRWESTIKHAELPKYPEMLQFLKEQCFVLERCEVSTPKPAQPQAKSSVPATKPPVQKTHAAVTSSEAESKCEFCGKPHQNFTCPEFKSLPVQQRLVKVREKNVCFNCLRKGHRSTNCSSERVCQKCKRRHHTLLHAEEKLKPTAEEGEPKSSDIPPKATDQEARQTTQMTTATCSEVAKPKQQVLLLTAVVDVMDKNHKPHPCRVLLDSGSQANLITQSMASALGLQLHPSNVTVSGVNGTRSLSASSSVVLFKSRYSDFRSKVNCLVTESVTADLPTSDVDIRSWILPAGIQLADPSFYRSGKIDMLLGNQLFLKLLLPGEISLADNLPILRETQLGWVVGGVVEEDADPDFVVHSHTVTLEELGQSIQRFWEVEDVGEDFRSSTEEEECEAHFQATHRRDASGRYVVQLPLREAVNELKDSRLMALKRFYGLEKRLNQQPELKKQYQDFIAEYEELGHCKQVNEAEDSPDTIKWYLPHHAVLRPSNTTTKCRVVFDASAKVSGVSLNDAMKVGAIQQSDLLSIMLRFREPRYVLSTDVAKMYRQVVVEDCHIPLQRILWRQDPSQPIRVLELTTVTYGTASAPFLATRALQQLASDEREKYPVAADIVERSFYVDNALFGYDDFLEAESAQRQLIDLLKSGGFHLHKWASNEPRLLESIPEEDQDELVSISELGANEVIKTMGLLWNPAVDELQLVSSSIPDHQKPTKRQVLSLIARMFDPLGLVAPVIVIGKLLMQQIWSEEKEWDEELTSELKKKYEYFLKALSGVSELKIPRQVIVSGASVYELHGFADASKDAYGACVYLRSVVPSEPASVRLLCAKSKIAPKSVLTIPRKELLAAVLLHRLVKKVRAALTVTVDEVVLWSDSQVVLAWLRKNPSLLEVFVRNRVCEITATGNEFEWRYVRTDENPADVLSRGQSADKLAANELWWYGPRFLHREEYQLTVPPPLPGGALPEMKKGVVAAAIAEPKRLEVFEKFGSFRKLQRVLGYVLRFCKNATEKVKEWRTTSPFPTVEELQRSLKVIVKEIQSQSLSDEIAQVRSGKPCKKISSLSPFLEDGLLRVGGRLRHSNLPYDTKHQLVLPGRSPLTESLIRTIHKENLHIGPAGLLALLRQQFWILGGRSAVRKVTSSCVRCHRVCPSISDQLMGDLPAVRCERALGFQKTGVDFAGPFFVKLGGKKSALVKGYICVFVCLVTKGIHLEFVENLSTEAFIAALHRFVSRRGLPEEILSDNGTNFIGAKNELRELYLLFKQQATQQMIFEFCQVSEIRWRTIPPSAPHMGGIWEAGVKSVKTALKKVCQVSSLTVVEFYTLLCQIEAQLNSRPLYAHSEDPSEPEPLTPGHLMIDRPLLAIPEPSYDGIPVNRLSRWQYIQKLRTDFWKRWSQQYLVELQTRSKWMKKQTNVRPGMVVLIKDENLPPTHWKMGRIERTYPGADNIVRVVDVRTKAGVLKRPVHKLAPLPILDNLPDSSEAALSPGEDVRSDSPKEK